MESQADEVAVAQKDILEQPTLDHFFDFMNEVVVVPGRSLREGFFFPEEPP
jgi:hypothetical protein